MNTSGQPPHCSITILSVRENTTIRDGLVSFQTICTGKLPEYCSQEVQNALKATEGLAIVVCEGYKRQLAHILKIVFDGHGQEILEDGFEQQLPYMGESGQNLKFSLPHIRFEIRTAIPNPSPPSLPLGNGVLLPVPISASIFTHTENILPSQPSRPLILLYSKGNENIANRLLRHYTRSGSLQKRWGRVEEAPYYVFKDLMSAFTDWGRVWNVLERLVELREEALYDKNVTFKDFEMGKDLHRDMQALNMLRELLRQQKNCTERLCKLFWMQEVNKVPFWENTRMVRIKIEEAGQVLDEYAAHASYLSRRQQNLLSMLNTKDTAKTATLAWQTRTTVMIFAPLLFGTTVFAINGFSIPYYVAILLIFFFPAAYTLVLRYRNSIPSLGFWERKPKPKNRPVVLATADELDLERGDVNNAGSLTVFEKTPIAQLNSVVVTGHHGEMEDLDLTGSEMGRNLSNEFPLSPARKKSGIGNATGSQRRNTIQGRDLTSVSNNPAIPPQIHTPFPPAPTPPPLPTTSESTSAYPAPVLRSHQRTASANPTAYSRTNTLAAFDDLHRPSLQSRSTDPELAAGGRANMFSGPSKLSGIGGSQGESLRTSSRQQSAMRERESFETVGVRSRTPRPSGQERSEELGRRSGEGRERGLYPFDGSR